MEISLHCYNTVVGYVTLLDDLPPDIVKKIVSSLKNEVYLPNDTIIKAGTHGDCMYFIISGTVAVSTPTGKEVTSSLAEGDPCVMSVTSCTLGVSPTGRKLLW